MQTFYLSFYLNSLIERHQTSQVYQVAWFFLPCQTLLCIPMQNSHVPQTNFNFHPRTYFTKQIPYSSYFYGSRSVNEIDILCAEMFSICKWTLFHAVCILFAYKQRMLCAVPSSNGLFMQNRNTFHIRYSIAM